MSRDVPDRALRVAVTAVGIAFALAYVVVALSRLRYPYEVEWIEGGAVDGVARILDGHGLYHRPSIVFTPNIYTPLYYYVSAAFMAVLGRGFGPMRLVSFLSSLVAGWAVYRLVVVETADRWAGLVAACLFAACFRIGGAWYDIARVDSLFVALVLLTLLRARTAVSWRGVAVAAGLGSLAFLTKQAALLPVAAVAVPLLRTRWRWAAVYLGGLAAGIGGSTVVLDLVSGGWYRFYVEQLPASHSTIHKILRTFWTHDIVRPMGIGLVLAVIALVVLPASARWFHVPVFVGMMLAAYSARLHTGGYDNVLQPAYVEIAVLAGITLGTANRWKPVLRWAVLTAVLVQLLHLTYDPRIQMPTASDRRKGAHLIEALRRLPGPVYLPGHPFYLARSGHATWAQGSAISDVLRSGHPEWSGPIEAQLREALAEHRFAAIVVDRPARYSYLPEDLDRWYRPAYRLSRQENILLPLTGTLTGPYTVWVPRS